MRLSKRIAAVALAAVMAVSMLTACGGGGSSSGGNNNNNGAGNGGNNSSSNVGGDTNGGGANSGSNNGSNSGTSTGGGTGSETKPTSTTLKNSRTGALMQKAMSSGQIQLVVVSNEYDETLQDYPQFTMARSGKNVCVQVASKDGSKKYLEEIGNGTERKAYLVLYPDCSMYKEIKKGLEDQRYNTENLTMPIYIEDEKEYNPNNSDLPIKWNAYEENAKVELGTYTYKKTKQTYDAEKLTDKDGDQIFCYDKSNTLRLIVEVDKDDKDPETGKVEEHISEVKSIAFTVNPAVFKVNKDAIDYREINNYVTKK